MAPEPIPTEFDPTTGALVNSVIHMGVTMDQLNEDQGFLTEMFRQVSSHDESIPMKRTTEVLDCAFIGLIYHRHMPFHIQEADGHISELATPDRAPNDYTFTLTALSNALIRQTGVTPVAIVHAAMEGAMLGRSHMRDISAGVDELTEELHKQFLALCVLGMVVHRLLPHSNKPLKEQGVFGKEANHGREQGQEGQQESDQ